MAWEQLLNIVAEGERQARAEAAAGPRICPNDATRLQRRPDGGLFCPFDGWTPERGTPDQS